MFSLTASPRTAPPSWRATLRRAVDLAVALTTLSDELPRLHADDLEAHPHRRPLHAPPRARRPGAASSRPQVCRTPVAAQRPRARRPLSPQR